MAEQKKATLYDPTGFDKPKVVNVGSKEATDYLYKGYVLTKPGEATKAATLFDKEGKGTRVISGSKYASDLLGKGYTLKPRDPTNPNDIINQNQEDDFVSIDEPPLGIKIPDLEKITKDFFTGLKDRPAAPNLSELYKDLFAAPSDENPGGLGVGDLQKSLTDLRAEENAIIEERKARLEYEGNKPVALGVISGKQSEIAKQEQDRLDSIALRRTAATEELNLKLDTVNTIIKLSQQDYDNAVASYDQKFSQALQAINLFRDLRQDQINESQRKIDNARANLTVVYNQIESGTLDWGSLDFDAKANITRLEMQSGFPPGFVKTLRSTKPNTEIVSTSARQESNGDKYSDIVLRDKNGKISVEHVFLGRERVPSSGGPSTPKNEGKGGKVTFNDVGGLSFTDDAGEPITAGQYAANKKVNLISTLRESKNADDADLISKLESVVNDVRAGNFTVQEAYTYLQQYNGWIFNGVSQSQFKQMLGL